MTRRLTIQLLLFILGDNVVLQSQPAWTIAVVVVFIILASVCATFSIALFTLMFWRKHKCKLISERLSISLGCILVVGASRNTTWQFSVHYKLNLTAVLWLADCISVGMYPSDHSLLTVLGALNDDVTTYRSR